HHTANHLRARRCDPGGKRGIECRRHVRDRVCAGRDANQVTWIVVDPNRCGGALPNVAVFIRIPLLGKGGVGVVGSTTAQIYSEFDRTTPAPLLCQGGEFSLKPFRWAKPCLSRTTAAAQTGSAAPGPCR